MNQSIEKQLKEILELIEKLQTTPNADWSQITALHWQARQLIQNH